jgi:hypothetical protein
MKQQWEKERERGKKIVSALKVDYSEGDKKVIFKGKVLLALGDIEDEKNFEIILDEPDF